MFISVCGVRQKEYICDRGRGGAQVCNPSAQEAEVGILGVCEASLGYTVRSYLKKSNNEFNTCNAPSFFTHLMFLFLLYICSTHWKRSSKHL